MNHLRQELATMLMSGQNCQVVIHIGGNNGDVRVESKRTAQIVSGKMYRELRPLEE